ncbi:cytochrome c [Gallaecimonas kandeliae]|uniref:c-type cytochrome n=1 Tax=Gallaecimonas kandeliae TaxID=3029055 RepID=UPI0026493397|nr:cytochrome c [Gallaecimonas kandeliae]WKE65308.1 cytochrome c [Gallaecimonas kandeliae]
MSKGSALRWLWRLLILAALALLVLVAAFAWYVQSSKSHIPQLEQVDQYRYLSDWDPDQRQLYYRTPQGTVLPQGAGDAALRYDWFLALEQPMSRSSFADPLFLRRFRFLADPVDPDGLPVGFTRRHVASLRDDVLDINCSACHTGQLNYSKDGRRYALRVDGGQAMHAFTDLEMGSFGPTLISALAETWANPLKFERFAEKVLKKGGSRAQLHAQLGDTLKAFLAIKQNNPLAHLYPTREGFGRTDALGRIANTLFGDHLDPANLQPSAAPVSYPYLWNMWKFNWVQYNGSVAQPLARNVGEALGVGADIQLLDKDGKALPPDQRFHSSVQVQGLEKIERALQQLPQPQWPEDILGKVDRAKAEQGRALFAQHCSQCHGPHLASGPRQQAEAPLKKSPADQWLIEVIGLDHIGTDPSAADNFMTKTYDLSATGLDQAGISALLAPRLKRQLARDMLMRLQELAADQALTEAARGDFAALAKAFPAPDALADAGFQPDQAPAIKAVLNRYDLKASAALSPDFQTPQLYCDHQCQLDALWFDLDLALDHIDTSLKALDPKHLTEGLGLNLVGLLVKQRYYQDHDVTAEQQRCLEGFGALDLPQQIAGYKPRPLGGVWATPPFLHNGSVPNLYQMLVPAAERDQRFFLGPREYDPVHLGYITKPLPGGEPDGFWFDTREPGNHNSGHSFEASPAQWQAFEADPKGHPLPKGVIGPRLSEQERMALLEYLKIHTDNPSGEPYQPGPACLAETH